jgi:hypothetical protein
MFGPISSGYPGKYVWICVAVFACGLYGLQVRQFLKSRRTLSSNTSTMDKKAVMETTTVSQLAGSGIFRGFFVIVALRSIYKHWPH